MSRNQIHIDVEPEVVFDVLDDACAYASWVVGTRRVLSVDASWPAAGSRFHHAIGNAAGELHDSSKVLHRDRPRELVLEVRFRPTGVARVTISVNTATDGSVVTLEELPTSGPVSVLPRLITDPVLYLRNAVSLQRLRHEVERRSTAEFAR
jgi:hypothetical protein